MQLSTIQCPLCEGDGHYNDGDVAGWYFKPVNQLANVNYVLIIND